MLKIKLARFGKKKQPHYRVVVNEARDKRDGKYTALVGHYAPTQKPKILEIDLKLYEEWLKKGAKPTETVAKLVELLKAGKSIGVEKKKNFAKKNDEDSSGQSKEVKTVQAEPKPAAVEEKTTEEVAKPIEKNKDEKEEIKNDEEKVVVQPEAEVKVNEKEEEKVS